MLLKFLREIAGEKYDVAVMPTLEGDDVIGIMATGKAAPVYVICSIDKDLKTIPGSHYNFGSNEFFEVTREEADYWHMIQTLTGDTTDGYSGCPGVGIKTAEKILQTAKGEAPWSSLENLNGMYWQAVVKAYAKAGFGEEEALVQARVARILRFDDYDFASKQVKLWTPN